MDVKTIVDAGPLIGWLNASDQWHEWSVATLSARRGALCTTEIVLSEACWHLGGNTKPAHALLSLVNLTTFWVLALCAMGLARLSSASFTKADNAMSIYRAACVW